MSLLSALVIGASMVAPKPNVVLFLVDDMGWQDTSLKFGLPEKVTGRQFRTPNLEKLAARGVQIDQAYASCPVCTPTRVALLTGVNPARNHITNWVQTGNDTDGAYPGTKSPDWAKQGLQPGDARTLAQVFDDAGYRTVQIGKAHFGAGGTEGANPTHLGFDKTIGGSAAGHPSSYYGLDNFAGKKKKPSDPPLHNDVPDLDAYHGKDVFLEDVLAIEGEKVISETVKSGKPLFLWYSPYAVHTPIMANKRLLSHYDRIDKTEAAYATMVESIDDALGRLVEALRKAGQLDNTYIVFTSDNGGLSASARGGYPNLHNLPLRSGKGSAYEGGTRVPFVVAGPGIKAGVEFTKAWVTSADLFSTLAELADLKVDPQDGFSFANALKQGRDEPRQQPNIWHYPHNRGGGGPGLEPFSSVRLGQFKAIFFYGTRTWELYNLQADLGETRDVIRRQPEKFKELSTLLISELKRMGAQFPIDEATGQAIEPKVP